MSSQGPLFHFQRVEKSFNQQPVLCVDELSLNAGETLILSGQNGAGKTTLMKIIAGLEKPDQGLVSHNGQQGSWKSLRAELINEIIYLHQQPYLFNTTVEDNLDYGLRQQGISAAERRRIVSQGLEWAGLSYLQGRNARVLSVGEKQRVALSRARVLNPRILLLDEPMASMDTDSRRQTCTLLQELKNSGVCIMICSHELEDVLPLGDRHLQLQSGKLIEANGL